MSTGAQIGPYYHRPRANKSLLLVLQGKNSRNTHTSMRIHINYGLVSLEDSEEGDAKDSLQDFKFARGFASGNTKSEAKKKQPSGNIAVQNKRRWKWSVVNFYDRSYFSLARKRLHMVFIRQHWRTDRDVRITCANSIQTYRSGEFGAAQKQCDRLYFGAISIVRKTVNLLPRNVIDTAATGLPPCARLGGVSHSLDSSVFRHPRVE